METQNIVRRDLDTFDAKFRSGEAVIHCAAVSDTKDGASRLSSCTQVDADKDRGHGQQVGMLKTCETSGSCTAGSVATSSDGFAVPSGSFQFQAHWKWLKNHPEEFYMYFKVTAGTCLC